MTTNNTNSTTEYTPEGAQRELMELIVKAGRRCAYDLAHAADWLPDPGSQATYRARAKMWINIFDPANGPKDYRHRLHQEIFMLERRIERLKALCIKHGVDANHPDIHDQF
ncbi:hypothetical protein RE432_15085 [Pusillimonas sp. SM2304]|uniref:hypothetical protein n=1 Tax=Pusillimonas sp. SM2304 TaxID=3073241 RepID=UPI0028757002|nr:hypothetical protein [Pusillimonas sp. SM2304]MDS1141764.1 hypothetical protein [Pusillimonas sp. SM2304]